MKKDHLLDAFKNKEISGIAMNKFTGGANGQPTDWDYQTDNGNAPGGWESDCGHLDNDMPRDNTTVIQHLDILN
jgi:hypothetical protein